MRFRPALSAALSLPFLVFSAASAHAQGTPNQPATEQLPPGPLPQPGPAPQPNPPGAAPQYQPQPGAQPGKGEEEPGDEGRLRIGFNVNGGVGSASLVSGPTIGATFRLGWQLNHLMGVYGQVSALVWFGTSSDTLAGRKFELGAIGGYQFTPMFSLTPVDLLEVAAGPSLDSLSGGTSSTAVAGTTVTQSASLYSGLYFALHGRIALHIGGRPNMKTGRRVGFTIGGDIHPVFAKEAITFYTIGLGADWY